ncbi:MAG: hypothetical protein ACXVAW_14545 [Vulcanimicrobiaceae bacterium]
MARKPQKNAVSLLSIAGVDLEVGSDDDQVHELISRRYARMQHDEVVGQDADAVKAYIMTWGGEPRVIIGEEVTYPCENDRPARGRRYPTSMIEGRSMLSINERIFNRRPELVVYHAAAIAVRDKAAIIVGPTTSGKSTTALSLLLTGSDNKPLSDEFALVNTRTGKVEAFPRLFSIRPGTRRLLELESLNWQWDAFEPAGVIAPSWADATERSAFFFITGRGREPEARPLTASEAIFLAIGSTMRPSATVRGLQFVDHIIAGFGDARLYSLTLGTPRATARFIESLLSEPALTQ